MATRKSSRVHPTPSGGTACPTACDRTRAGFGPNFRVTGGHQRSATTGTRDPLWKAGETSPSSGTHIPRETHAVLHGFLTKAALDRKQPRLSRPEKPLGPSGVGRMGLGRVLAPDARRPDGEADRLAP